MSKKGKKSYGLLWGVLVLVVGIAVVLTIYLYSKGIPTKSQFDENNIGEIYYSPIDSSHIVEDESGIMFADNEILVVAKENVSKSKIQKIAKKYNAEIVGYIKQTGDYQWRLQDIKSKDELSDIVKDIQSNKYINSASINSIVAIEDNSVDYDISTGNQWVADPLSETGKYFQDTKAWGVQTINAPFAWTLMNINKDIINPVKVGLLDNVFYTDHEDLSFAETFYNDSTKADNNNGKYHGTHVAGTFASKSSNKSGICGVYPYGDNNLYGVSIDGIESYKENNVNYVSENNKVFRILSIMELKIGYAELIFRNVKVINVSLGIGWKDIYSDKLIFMDVIDYKKIKELYESDLSEFEELSETLGDFLNRTLELGYDWVIISAAGNDSDTSIGNLESQYCSWNNMITAEQYPDVYNRIIVVGSIDKWYDNFTDEKSISSFSNAGNRVDVFAPGETIFSTIPGNKYGYDTGTSMASPHVAGVCANVWSIDNNLSGSDIKKIVCTSVIDDNFFYTCPNGNKKGVVDCLKAVQTAFEKRKDDNDNTNLIVNNGAVLGWIYETDKTTVIEDVNIIPYQSGKAMDNYKTTTDIYGHFEIVIPSGTYELHFNKENYKDYCLSVKVENGQINYLEESGEGFIILNREISDAEKYAQIVMDNENLWLDPLNNMYLYENESQTCWFEDVDFDGALEFIVGGCNMQTQAGIGYCIFKFKDDKMIKLYESYINRDSAFEGMSSTGNIPSRLRSPNPGFGEYSGEIIKDKNGKYRYIFPHFIGYLGTGYGIAELTLGDDTLDWSLIGGYKTDPVDYINNFGDSVSKNVLLDSLSEWFDGSSFCFANIGTIPCTYLNKKLDSEWYEAATNSDSGLNDAASAYVSGCYDGLSEDEKRAALIKSYNYYNIKEVDSESELYARIIRDMQSDKWKTVYNN